MCTLTTQEEPELTAGTSPSTTSPGTETEADLKPVTQQEVFDKVAQYGRKLPKIVFWGAVAYVALVPTCLVVGGIAASAGAAALGAGAILSGGAALLGVAAGAVGGFFAAKFVFKEMIGDVALNLGLDASEMSLRSLRRLLKDAKQNQGGAEKAPKTAALENATAVAHRGVLKLRKWFGDAAEKPEVAPPAPAPEVAAAPPPPAKLPAPSA